MTRFTTTLALVATFALAGGVQAQNARTADDARQELRALVTDGSAAADRAAIDDFLQGDAATEAAARYGLHLEEARDGVDALNASQAARLADRIADVEDRLAGGDTVVITGSTIIIILLILLLIEI